MITRKTAKAHIHSLLGDRVETTLKKIGVHQAVKAIERRTGWDCGCAKRQVALNAWSARRR